MLYNKTMCKKAFDIYDKHEISFPIRYRIMIGAALLLFLIGCGLNTWRSKSVNNDTKDTNVYLGEEICYAGGIYIKANSISVDSNIDQENSLDDDGDNLSKYTLNLGLEIERRGGNFWTSTVKLKSQYFSLKSINLKAKNKMAIFFELLAKETVAAAVGIAIGGSVNIIEETVNYIEEYTSESIENAANSSVDFKPIKCSKNQFEPFKPVEGHEPYFVSLSFPIKQEYLDSENLITLSIDQVTHFEQRIFLIKRP